MIDTHSHLDGEEFAEDLPEVIQRAKDSGIKAIFIPGICRKDTQRVFDTCKEFPGYLYPMIGLHPENIMDEDYHEALRAMEKILKEKMEMTDQLSKPIAIGEIGIDLYWDSTYRNEQIEAFRIQVEWALKYKLPIMVHARNAHKELIQTLEPYRKDQLSGVFHCFTGTGEEATDLLSFEGFMLGIGGVSTFKKSTLPETLKKNIPLSRIVLETDSPYMAPVPNRGKRNESSFIPYIVCKLAEVYNVTEEEIIRQTTENTSKVFRNCSFFKKN